MPTYRDVVVSLSLTVLFVGIAACGSDSNLEPDASPVDPSPDYGSNSRIEPASVDPDVEFPQALSDLPGSPRSLAVDANGDLWFPIHSYIGSINDLYHYVPASGSVETRTLPTRVGIERFSATAVDSRGHVIAAENERLFDVGPDGETEDIHLPTPVNFLQQSRYWQATPVIDLALSETDTVYMTRKGVAAITQLDLRTGSVSEIPLPISIGQMDAIELTGDRLWMSGDGFPSSTWVLDLATEELRRTAIQSSELLAVGDERVYYTGQSGEGLVAANAIDAAFEAGPWAFDDAADYVEWSPPWPEGWTWTPAILAADEARGRIWMYAAGVIASLEPSSGAVEYYRLPSFSAEDTHLPSIPIGCSYNTDLCPEPRGAFTQIGGIAVAPNGDVFFSDGSYNRIGIVHPR